MTSELWIAALIVIACLLAIAGFLHFRLHQQRQITKARDLQVAEAARIKRQQINESVQILCRALLARQVEYAEASVRISGLLDTLGVSEQEREDFVAFDKMAAAIKHVPMLGAWNALPKEERQRYRQQIDAKERELGDFLDDAARRLSGRTF